MWLEVPSPLLSHCSTHTPFLPVSGSSSCNRASISILATLKDLGISNRGDCLGVYNLVCLRQFSLCSPHRLSLPSAGGADGQCVWWVGMHVLVSQGQSWDHLACSMSAGLVFAEKGVETRPDAQDPKFIWDSLGVLKVKGQDLTIQIWPLGFGGTSPLYPRCITTFSLALFPLASSPWPVNFTLICSQYWSLISLPPQLSLSPRKLLCGLKGQLSCCWLPNGKAHL